MLSIYYRTKPQIPIDKHRLVEIFFKDWVDTICDRKVQFSIERDISKEWLPGMVTYQETFRVDFEKSEDALVMQLRGVPAEFGDYLEMVR